MGVGWGEAFFFCLLTFFSIFMVYLIFFFNFFFFFFWRGGGGEGEGLGVVHKPKQYTRLYNEVKFNATSYKM